MLPPLVFLTSVLILGAGFSVFSIHDRLIGAARDGDLATVKRLAIFDWNVSRTGFEEHVTPLGAAVQAGHSDIVRFLLRRGGIDVNGKGDHGETALMLARRHGRHEIADLLVKAGANE